MCRFALGYSIAHRCEVIFIRNELAAVDEL